MDRNAKNRVLCLGIGLITSLFFGAAARAEPNAVDFAVYFDSDVRDADECAMRVEDGRIVIDAGVANPSMSCPDMFSWKLFAEVVQQQWWATWASDQQTWPKAPYRLCKDGEAASDCCQPGAADNPGYGDTSDTDYANATHCPYFPGDHQAAETLDVEEPRQLGEPIGAHAVSLGRGGLPSMLTTTAVTHPGEPEPGRVIRQEVGEITVRNKPMFDYIFSNDLYNAQGVASVFTANSDNLTNNAPYQATNDAGNLSKVDLPISAIMIKSNWLYHEFARDMGIVDDPAAPFIKKEMITTIGDKHYQGEHWLMAFHISTKDIPQWVWTTFEHVNNPGRCDFTGCNDAYGYASADPRPNGTVGNFTAPNVRNDGLQNSSIVFDLGKTYSSGPASRELLEIFSALEIGVTAQADRDPEPTDRAWLSYRLKGSQVNFTNAMGRSTRLGNSITEGGFMNTSSCITCHARASVAVTGEADNPLSVPLGVFQYDVLNEVGYQQSVNGIPDKDWYHGSGFQPRLQALQTDFIWGMPLFVKPLATAEQ